MSNRGEFIPRGRNDEKLLATVSEQVYREISNNYIFKLPENWGFDCPGSQLKFEDIKSEAIRRGMSEEEANSYYGIGDHIDTDGYIIYLTIQDGNQIIKKPIFMGEMKKQGTNDKRLLEGKTKQAQGNAAGDRVAKNFLIAADYCYLCDNEFFPYNVFMHGWDFSETQMTSTTKSKVKPLFGELNNFNPWFDKKALNIFGSKKGGSCFYQGEDFTPNQLHDLVYRCCEEGVKYYLSKYGESK